MTGWWTMSEVRERRLVQYCVEHGSLMVDDRCEWARYWNEDGDAEDVRPCDPRESRLEILVISDVSVQWLEPVVDDE